MGTLRSAFGVLNTIRNHITWSESVRKQINAFSRLKHKEVKRSFFKECDQKLKDVRHLQYVPVEESNLQD